MQFDDEQKETESEETESRKGFKRILVGVGVALGVILTISYFRWGLPWADYRSSTPVATHTAPPAHAAPAARHSQVVVHGPCNHEEKTYELDDRWQPVQPDTAPCSLDLIYHRQDVKLYVKTWGDPDTAQGPYNWGEKFPNDVIAIKSEGKVLRAKVALVPKRFSAPTPIRHAKKK